MAPQCKPRRRLSSISAFLYCTTRTCRISPSSVVPSTGTPRSSNDLRCFCETPPFHARCFAVATVDAKIPTTMAASIHVSILILFRRPLTSFSRQPKGYTSSMSLPPFFGSGFDRKELCEEQGSSCPLDGQIFVRNVSCEKKSEPLGREVVIRFRRCCCY